MYVMPTADPHEVNSNRSNQSSSWGQSDQGGKEKTSGAQNMKTNPQVSSLWWSHYPENRELQIEVLNTDGG